MSNGNDSIVTRGVTVTGGSICSMTIYQSLSALTVYRDVMAAYLYINASILLWRDMARWRDACCAVVTARYLKPVKPSENMTVTYVGRLTGVSVAYSWRMAW